MRLTGRNNVIVSWLKSILVSLNDHPVFIAQRIQASEEQHNQDHVMEIFIRNSTPVED